MSDLAPTAQVDADAVVECVVAGFHRLDQVLPRHAIDERLVLGPALVAVVACQDGLRESQRERSARLDREVVPHPLRGLGITRVVAEQLLRLRLELPHIGCRTQVGSALPADPAASCTPSLS